GGSSDAFLLASRYRLHPTGVVCRAGSLRALPGAAACLRPPIPSAVLAHWPAGAGVQVGALSGPWLPGPPPPPQPPGPGADYPAGGGPAPGPSWAARPPPPPPATGRSPNSRPSCATATRFACPTTPSAAT